ncbi:MAG: hypothetical protein MJE63_32670 [Proteobacteria bacterium]|nr:hypothetical protein [Pseudomonadota bacterium]
MNQDLALNRHLNLFKDLVWLKRDGNVIHASLVIRFKNQISRVLNI